MQAPKTPNALRLVDIPEALAQVLHRYTEGKAGYLFTTRAGRLLDQGNSLKALRGAGVPENLIKQWMGHSQNLMDLYAAKLRYDVPTVANDARALAWDLSWANWATNGELQFAHH